MVIAILSAFGISAATGLKAYLPLLIVGLLSRFTDWITLKSRGTYLGGRRDLRSLGFRVYYSSDSGSNLIIILMGLFVWWRVRWNRRRSAGATAAVPSS
jgi:hypothetical protein